MAHAAPRAETERDGRRPVRTGLAVVGLFLVIAFGVTLYGGYGPDDWTWTGFEGAQLWDWLHVLLLPIAFVLVAVLMRAKELGAWRAVIGGACLGLFIALVVAGYTVPWDWTCFVGNTLFDWLQLLFLPVVIPLVVIPLVVALRRQHLHQSEQPPAGEPTGRGGEARAEPSEGG